MVKDYTIEVWKGHKMGSTIALDTETNFADFHTRDHKMITCQVYDGKGIVYFVEKKDIMKFMKLHKDHNIVGQNIPFDVGVLSKITGMDTWFEFYDADRIWDTKILYMLYTLAATGQASVKSSLKLICLNLLGRDIDKNHDIRTGFEQFENTPIMDIPMEYLRYAAEDAIHTYDAYFKLRNLIREHDKYNTVLSHHIQVKGALALDDIHKNGLGFDLETAKLRLSELDTQLLSLKQRLAVWGYVQGRAGITDDYERIITHIGLADKLPRSKKTQKITQKSSELEPYSDYPFVSDYLKFEELHKLTTFLRGVEDDTLHGRFNPLLNTGRVSMSKPNIQQLPKTGGIRECFIPKSKDNVFVDADYSAIELVALAEYNYITFGESRMRDLINDGLDLHVATAAEVFEKNPGKTTKDECGDVLPEERQFAKIVNFGLGGGMGATTFADNAKKEGFDITEEFSKHTKESWIKTYPEIGQFFKESYQCRNGRVMQYENGDTQDLHTHYTLTGRKREDCGYSAFLNTTFQGLAADGCKLAIYECMKAGLHMVLVLHDQIMVEANKNDVEDVQIKLESCMLKGMTKVIKNTKVGVKVQVLERFCK